MIALAGFLIALAVGMTGVGAGSLTVAALVLFFAEDPAESVGTALVFTVVIKAAVLPVYARRGLVHRATLGRLLAGGVPAALAGVAALEYMNLRGAHTAILLTIGGIVSTVALYNLIAFARRAKHVGGTVRCAILPWAAIPIGAATGFSSAGAGALGSVLLLHATTLAPAEVVGTDLAFGFILSGVGALWHIGALSFDPRALLLLSAGGLPGVFLGARAAAQVPARHLRLAISLALAAFGFQMCWRALR